MLRSANQRRAPRMANPLDLRNVSCPLQRNEDDIPIIWHDIQGGVQGLRQVLATLNHRDSAIAPFHVYDVPVTPYKNPITNLTSHHIIRMWDSQPAEKVDHTYVLDLLICDDNTYFAAFRRIRFTLEEFEVFRAGGGGGQGGTWFCLIDSNVPPFLNATQIGVNSAYVDATWWSNGLTEYIQEFEWIRGGRRWSRTVTKEIRLACNNVMVMYCEVRRLRSLLILVNDHLHRSPESRKLEDKFWKLIHRWADLSTVVLEDLLDGKLAPENVTREWCARELGLATTAQLIGGWLGELLKVKLRTEYLGMTKSAFDEHWLSCGGNVREPGFVQQL